MQDFAHIQELKKVVRSNGELAGDHVMRKGQVIITKTSNAFRAKRAYVWSVTTSKLSEVGWILDGSTAMCLHCGLLFGKLAWKHHCRACGNLVCSSCTSSAQLKDFPALRNQKVCLACKNRAGVGFPVPLLPSPLWGSPLSTAECNRMNPEIIMVHPIPGFVIKTMDYGKNGDSVPVKVFVNVFHHPRIQDSEFILTAAPVVIAQQNKNNIASTGNSNGNKRRGSILPTALTAVPAKRRTGAHAYSNYESYSTYRVQKGEPSQSVDHINIDTQSSNIPGVSSGAVDGAVPTGAGGDEPSEVPVLYFGLEKSTATRRDGSTAMLYNVIISSSYFEQTTVQQQTISITHRSSVNKIIQALNRHFDAGLNEHAFLLPRISKGYVGPAIITHADDLSKPQLTTAASMGRSTPTSCETESTDASAHDPSETGAEAATAGHGVTIIAFRKSTSRVYPTDPDMISDSGENSHSRTTSVSSQVSQYNWLTESVKLTDSMHPSPVLRFGGGGSGMNVSDYSGGSRSSSPVMPAVPTRKSRKSVVSSSMTGLNNHHYNNIRSGADADTAAASSSSSSSSRAQILGVGNVTADMLELRIDGVLGLAEDSALKKNACHNPGILVGHQIILPYTSDATKDDRLGFVDQSKVYVVISWYKNNRYQTIYCVTNTVSTTGVKEVQLKRAEGRKGEEFRIICCIL